jgi:hypothetical protein
VAKHPPKQHNQGGKAFTLNDTTTAAKHPPDDDLHSPDEVDKEKQRQAHKPELPKESR